jgi:hypothetical protein
MAKGVQHRGGGHRREEVYAGEEPEALPAEEMDRGDEPTTMPSYMHFLRPSRLMCDSSLYSLSCMESCGAILREA